MAEFAGTFVLVAFCLIAVDKTTRHSEDRAINAMIISANYIGARLMSGGRLVTGIPQSTETESIPEDNGEFDNIKVTFYRQTGSLLNPGVGIGFQIVSLDFSHVIAYTLMPLLGAVAALFFHEVIFMRT